MRRNHVTSSLAALGFAAGLAAPPAAAQAWLAPRGEASFSLGYSNVFVKDHFYDSGQRFDHGRVYSHTVSPVLGYAVTDRLTLSLGVPPLVMARYSGVNPHALPIDDGRYKPALQDLSAELRFSVLRQPIAITPFVAGSVPSHHYEYLGHSAIGRDEWNAQVGVNAGWRMDPLLPDAYLHARYTYTFAQKIIGISHDASNVDVELGYFVTPALTVRGLSAWQIGHGGLGLGTGQLKAPLNFLHHDQVTNVHSFNIGAGAAYALTRNLDLFGGWFKTLSGRNGHAVNRGLSLGFSVNFSPAQLVRRMRSPAPDARR